MTRRMKLKRTFRKVIYRTVNQFVKRSNQHVFVCNICSSKNLTAKEKFGREIPTCNTCGSTVRMRSIIHGLSLSLFGESLCIDEFSCKSEVRGFGMGDWRIYADRLKEKFNYQNTFYHREPYFDILNPDENMLGQYDFIISSDVYEHVHLPISLAFENSRRLLKTNGYLIFSVPYILKGSTIEHYPDLNNFKIERRDDSFV